MSNRAYFAVCRVQLRGLSNIHNQTKNANFFGIVSEDSQKRKIINEYARNVIHSSAAAEFPNGIILKVMPRIK